MEGTRAPVNSESDTEISELLERHRSGDETAFGELTEALYGELRRLAAYQLRSEREGHTLQPTALVHEAYLRMCRRDGVTVATRLHFLSLAARVMRNILVDYARSRETQKREGMKAHVDLDEALAIAGTQDVGVIELDEVLEELSRVDPDLCRIVELRVFGGLTVPEVAETIGVSRSSVDREWATARAWLRKRLSES